MNKIAPAAVKLVHAMAVLPIFTCLMVNAIHNAQQEPISMWIVSPDLLLTPAESTHVFIIAQGLTLLNNVQSVCPLICSQMASAYQSAQQELINLSFLVSPAVLDAPNAWI